MTMRLITGLVVSVLALGTLRALGQAPADANTGRPVTEDDIAVLRQDLNTETTEIITRNMKFTEEQAKAFWPVYRDYAHEQQAIWDRRVALINDFVASHDTIDDAQADSFLARALKLEEDSFESA
jgi:hypothetical protein